MKQQIKYCTIGMTLLLLNVMAMWTLIQPNQICEKQQRSYVVVQNCDVNLLHYIHVSQLCESCGSAYQTPVAKYSDKTDPNNSYCGAKPISKNSSEKSIHHTIHESTIQYYIYTLEKVVT